MLSTRRLVVLEACTAAAVAGALALAAPWWAAAAVAAVTFALGLVGTPVARALCAHSTFLLRSRVAQPSMTGPTIEVATPDGPIGARWNGTTVTTVIALNAPGPSIQVIRPGPRHGDQYSAAPPPLPLDLIADSLRQNDIHLASVDVVSHARRLHPSSPLAEEYHRIVGPLPATAHRVTYLLLRLDPADNAAAVARRGGDIIGAHRAAALATRRLAQRLREAGHRARPLGADIDRAEVDLLDGQHAPKLSEHIDSMRGGHRQTITYSIQTGAIPEVLATCWAAATDTTSVTLTLAPADGGRIAISGLLRHTATGHLPPPPAGVRQLSGRQRRALATSLPGGPDPTDLAPTRVVAIADLHVLSVTTTGCGQLLGADPTGAAVFAPVFGPAVAAVSVTADIPLIRQIVLRAIAIGARTVVHTERPVQWRPLASSIGDSEWLLITGPGRARGAFDLNVLDGVRVADAEPAAPPAPATVLTVIAPGTPNPPAAGLRITQNNSTANDFVITANGRSVPVTMVTTDDERAWLVVPDDGAVEDPPLVAAGPA